MVSLRPMTPTELSSFLATSLRDHVAERVAAGERPEVAEPLARAQQATMFPDGRPAARHALFCVLEGDAAVGSLWLGPASADEHDGLWVWDITIDESHRGRGIGRATMELAEQQARARGASELGLSVFGRNAVARHLYASLGYETVAVRMVKRLTDDRRER